MFLFIFNVLLVVLPKRTSLPNIRVLGTAIGSAICKGQISFWISHCVFLAKTMLVKNSITVLQKGFLAKIDPKNWKHKGLHKSMALQITPCSHNKEGSDFQNQHTARFIILNAKHHLRLHRSKTK